MYVDNTQHAAEKMNSKSHKHVNMLQLNHITDLKDHPKIEGK